MGDVRDRRVPATLSCSTPCHPPPPTSALQQSSSLGYTQPPCPLALPSTPPLSTLPSFASRGSPPVILPLRVSPCLPPPHVVSPDVLPPTSVSPPSSATPPVPLVSSPTATAPASFPSVTMPSKPLRTSRPAPRHPSTMDRAKRASPPSSDDSSSDARSSGRIVPAHSHSDYNKRDFTRSAVPGSVYNLSVTF